MTSINVEAREAIAVNSTDEEAKRIRRQRVRSTAIALGLAFLVILFYAATIVRMGGNKPVGEFAPGSGQSAPAPQPSNGGAP